jgi:ATP-dependent DNA helicase RecQ
MTPNETLKRYWGYDQFRPLQIDIIEEAMSGKDVFGILPTGGGKSVCFQVPALMKEGICLVVTPLISLMRDQVENLKKREISAVAIYSGMNARQVDLTLDNCIYGNVKFLYFSPERIENYLFQERVKKMNVSQIVVDEAHCISQWGHDFRPSYFGITKLREYAPDAPILAFTATATKQVRAEIREKLELNISKIFLGSFARKNLSYSVRKVEDKEAKIHQILTNTVGSAIIYTPTRKRAKEISAWLNQMNISSSFYHAGLTFHERESIQDKWMAGAKRVVVATNAFGMGIDKPDVRVVIHVGINSDMESYYQEAGRAGRDTEKAYATIVYQEEDIETTRNSFHRSYPSLAYIQHVYQCLANYYKLAVGSEHYAGYDFQLYKFSDQYKLEHLEVFHALKKLEEYDLIQFSEVVYHTSSLFMQFDHRQLYEFQVSNAQLDPIIKVILRLYGGELFTQFMKISEYKIATTLKQSEAAVAKKLQLLHKKGVVSYAQKKELPQLVFVTPRMDARSLPIAKKAYDNRRSVEFEKLNFMIKYVSEYNGCRTNLIQDYFGESPEQICGICDHCIEDRPETNTEFELENYICQLLNQERYTTQALAEKLPGFQTEEILDVVRKLLDAGVLEEKDGKLQLT